MTRAIHKAFVKRYADAGEKYPFMAAIKAGDERTLMQVLRHPGFTVGPGMLKAALKGGHALILSMLLQEYKRRDSHGRVIGFAPWVRQYDSLTQACSTLDPEIVKLILTITEEPEVGVVGFTLDQGARNNRQEEADTIVRMLVAAGADIEKEMKLAEKINKDIFAMLERMILESVTIQAKPGRGDTRWEKWRKCP